LNKGNPRISVIMPVYNSEETVYFSIKSVLNQTYSDFDFIIVNDGSTDKSENIILSFKDERIKYFKLDHKGRSSASNYGISKATGEYIARIDADDMFISDKLSKQMQYLDLHTEVDIMSSWSVFYENTGLLRFWKSPGSDLKIKEKLKYLNPINHSSVVCKRDIFLTLSGYDESLDINEDYDLWLRAGKHFRFYCLQEYRVFSLLKKDNFKKKYNKDLVSLLTRNILDDPGINEKERNDLLGRVEYYFGNTDEARKRLLKGNIPVNIKLLIYLFLPGAVLNVLRGKRLSLFMSTNLFNVSSFRNTLKQMLSV
jgi:glycosyltransferase involved in cell wall biosynthesis